MKKIVFALCLLLFPVLSHATIYYVDSSITDTNVASATPDFTTYNPTTFATDTGSDSVYKTIADINAKSFTAGDSVLLRRGQSWRETIVVAANGGSSTYTTFGAFGSGSNPLLIGSDVFSASGATLTSGQTYTYELAAATSPAWVWENEVPLNEKTSIATVEATAGTWWWDTSVQKTYIHPYDNSNPASNGKTYELSTRTENINTNNKSYLIFDGINCTRSAGLTGSPMGGIMITGNYTIAQNFTSWGHRRHCGSFYDNAHDNQFINAVFTDSYITAAISVHGAGTYNNTIHHCEMAAPLWGVTNGADAFILHGGAYNNTIEDNDIHDGQLLMTLGGAGTAGNVIQRNHIYGTTEVAIQLGTTCNTTTIRYNVIDILATSVDGVIAATTSHATNSVIYNNTIYLRDGSSQTYAFDIQGNSTGTKIKNNIVHGTKGTRVATTAQSGAEVDYNIYLLTGTTIFTWGETAYTTFADWKTASSQDAHSINGDPLFTSAAVQNFTLSYNSPARDSGVNVGLTSDYVLNSLPRGGGVDMGAYEFAHGVLTLTGD